MVLMQSLPAVQCKPCRLSSINHNRKWQSRMYSIFTCRNHTNTWKMLVKHTQNNHIKDICWTVKTSIQSFCKNPFDIKSINAGNSIKLLNSVLNIHMLSADRLQCSLENFCFLQNQGIKQHSSERHSIIEQNNVNYADLADSGFL